MSSETEQNITPKKKKDLKNIFNAILMIFTVIMVLYVCINDNNLYHLIMQIPKLNTLWLIMAFSSIFVSWTLDATLMYAITKTVYANKYSWWDSLKITMVGQFFSSVTPMAVAGQPMQIYYMSRQGVSAGVAISILVRKFLIYQVALTCYSTIILFTTKTTNIFVLIGFATQAGIVLLLALFSTNKLLATKLIDFLVFILSKIRFIKNPQGIGDGIKKQLEFYVENNKSMNHNLKLTVQLYFITFIQLTVLFSIPFLVYKAFNNEGYPFFEMIQSQGILTMLSSYTPLPGGSGTAEVGFSSIFGAYFGDSTNMAMLLWRWISYYMSIIVGYGFSNMGKKKEKLKEVFKNGTNVTDDSSQTEE